MTRQLRLWLPVLGRQGKTLSEPNGKYCQWSIISREKKRGYHCYRRMPQRPGTDGCGVYRGISAGINGYNMENEMEAGKRRAFFVSF